MSSPAHPTEFELHAFVDDELSPARRAEIAAVLRKDPALAAQVAAWQTDRDRLRLAFANLPEAPLPSAWIAQIEAATAGRKRTVWTRRFAIGAGAAGMALAAGIAALVILGHPPDRTILAAAEAARDGRLAGRLAGGDALPPPAARDALVQATTGLRVRTPDLQRWGFRLTQIALFGPSGRGAAQLQYADQRGRQLTIFVRGSDGTVRFDIIRHGEMHICVWQDNVVGTVIMAEVSAAEMLHIAASAYTDLNL